MFTGIIEEIGTVAAMEQRTDLLLWNGERGEGWELTVRCPVAADGAYLGCSIAVNGTCLTATAINGDLVAFGVAPESYVRRVCLLAVYAQRLQCCCYVWTTDCAARTSASS